MKEAANRGGRPRLPIDAEAAAKLRASGQSWRVIAQKLEVSVRTLRRACQSRGKSVAKPIPGPSASNPSQEISPSRQVFGFARTRKWRAFAVSSNRKNPRLRLGDKHGS